MSFYFLKIPSKFQERKTNCVVKMDVGKKPFILERHFKQWERKGEELFSSSCI